MQQRRRTIIVILAIVAGVALLILFVNQQFNQNKYKWYETYDSKSDQPYGLLFMRKMLEDYANKEFYYNNKLPAAFLLDSTRIKTKSSYVFIGQYVYQTENDVQALLNYVHAGNDALFISREIPELLQKELYKEQCLEYIETMGQSAESVNLAFLHDSLRISTANQPYAYTYMIRDKPTIYYWTHLDPEVFCSENSSITPLGLVANGGVNFFRISHGSGYFYFHTTPFAFTNYALIRPESVEYAAKVFSHMHTEHIVFDDFAKLPSYGSRNTSRNGPLSILLQEPALKYAWWMLLATVIIYVWIAAKRQQRVIPVIEPKANTSMAFVELISTLHFQNGNHLEAARKKMKYFYHFCKTRYGVNLQQGSKEQLKVLAEKSKVKEEEIQLILDHFKLIDKYSYTSIAPERLMDLYQSIENFYKKCI
ncbi:MAG: hypothetical protein ACOVOF_05695 [Chryseotalea sp.]|jgi:hypothetical protein|nr:hypothetical protein [Flammeovirgaceae bacterium]